MPLGRVAIVAAALTAVWSAVAEAGDSRFRELGRLPSVPVTDGSRYVAWTDSASYVEVVDTAEHRTNRVDLPPDCAFVTIGVGHLVFVCGAGSGGPSYGSCPRVEPVFYNLATGGTHTPPDIEGFYEQQGFAGGGSSECKHYPNDPASGARLIAELGPIWFRYTIGAFPYWEQWYLDWHQGGDPVRTTEARDSVIDLAEADRLKSLCSPVRRKRDPSYDPDDAYGDSPPHPYFDLEWVGRRTVTVNGNRELVLQRCGHTRVRRLARDVGYHGGPDVGYYWGIRPRAVYWTKGEKIHFFILRTKRKVAYRLPIRHQYRQAIATDTRLYVTDWDGWDPSIRTTFVTKIPRR